jgi:hypothetical protein
MPSSLENAFGELRRLRKQARGRDLTPQIEALLSQPWTEDEARVLRGELIGELHRHDRHAEAEVLLRAEIEREPQEPFHYLCLAEHFHYYHVDLSQSLKHVAQAIAKAAVDGKFMYQALGVQARLAIEAQDWPLLEASLRSLATYEHTPGNADVFPETDFLSRIPAGTVADDTLSSYLERVEYLRSINYSTMHGPRNQSR